MKNNIFLDNIIINNNNMKKGLLNKFGEKERNSQIRAKEKLSKKNIEKKSSYSIDIESFGTKLREPNNLQQNNLNLKNYGQSSIFIKNIKKNNNVNLKDKNNNYDEEYFITKLKKLKQRFPLNKRDLSKSSFISKKITNNKLFSNSAEKIIINEPNNKTNKISIKNKKKAIKIKKLNLLFKKNLKNKKETKNNYKMFRILSGNDLSDMTINNPCSLYVFNTPINLNYNNYTLSEGNIIPNNYSNNSNNVFRFRLSPIINKKESNVNANRSNYYLYNKISPNLYNNKIFRKAIGHGGNYNKNEVIKEYKTENYDISISKNEENRLNTDNNINKPIYFRRNLGNCSINMKNNQNSIRIPNTISKIEKNRNTIYLKAIPKPKKLNTSPYIRKNMITSNKKKESSRINSFTEINMNKYKKSNNKERNDFFYLDRKPKPAINISPTIQYYYELMNEKKWEKKVFSNYKTEINPRTVCNVRKVEKNMMGKVKNKCHFLKKYYKYNFRLPKEKCNFVTY